MNDPKPSRLEQKEALIITIGLFIVFVSMLIIFREEIDKTMVSYLIVQLFAVILGLSHIVTSNIKQKKKEKDDEQLNS